MNDVPLEGKTVLVRADYNVPLADDGTIQDDYRIRMSVDTIRALLAKKCKVVIISHLGRPDGERNEKYSIEPAANRLAELLGQPVQFIDDCIGEKPRMFVKQAALGTVTVLEENVRFYAGEEANDETFARELARRRAMRTILCKMDLAWCTALMRALVLLRTSYQVWLDYCLNANIPPLPLLCSTLSDHLLQ